MKVLGRWDSFGDREGRLGGAKAGSEKAPLRSSFPPPLARLGGPLPEWLLLAPNRSLSPTPYLHVTVTLDIYKEIYNYKVILALRWHDRKPEESAES